MIKFDFFFFKFYLNKPQFCILYINITVSVLLLFVKMVCYNSLLLYQSKSGKNETWQGKNKEMFFII